MKITEISSTEALMAVAGAPDIRTDDGYCNRFLPVCAWKENTSFVSAQKDGQTLAMISVNGKNEVGKLFFLDKKIVNGQQVQEICMLMLKKAMQILKEPVFFDDNLCLSLREAYNALSDDEKKAFPSFKKLLVEEYLYFLKKRKEEKEKEERKQKNRERFIGAKGKKRKLSKWFSLYGFSARIDVENHEIGLVGDSFINPCSKKISSWETCRQVCEDNGRQIFQMGGDTKFTVSPNGDVSYGIPIEVVRKMVKEGSFSAFPSLPKE